MTKLEELEQLSSDSDIYLFYQNFKSEKIKGLYADNTIALSNNLSNDAERACVLAEELGHYNTSVGNILDTSDLNAAKQELKARRYAHGLLVSMDMLYKAKLSGCTNTAEVAEFMGITEEFLKEALENLESRYGTNYNTGQCSVSFNPFDIELIIQKQS